LFLTTERTADIISVTYFIKISDPAVTDVTLNGGLKDAEMGQSSHCDL
jgi:hypothetical protein